MKTKRCRVRQVNAVTGAIGSRQTEDIERASLCRVLRQILHRINKPKSRGWIARVQFTGHDCPGPATYPRQDRNVLLAVWSQKSCRLPNDPRSRLKRPKNFPSP